MSGTIGDIAAAARAIATARTPGALCLIEARLAGASLAAGDEASLLETAWSRVVGRLPDGAIARRAGHASFDAVVAGERDLVLGLGRGLLGALVADRSLARCAWQVVLVRISDDAEAADRALQCDASDDVAAAAGDVLAWVEPYAGADWRYAGRLPAVTFEPTLVRRTPT